MTWYALLALILIGLSALILIGADSWRWRLAALFGQYLGAFLLIGLSWPWSVATIKLIPGWVSVAILGLALNTYRPADRDAALAPFQRAFNLLAAVLIGLFTLSIGFWKPEFLPNNNPFVLAGGLLIGVQGLLRLGLRETLLNTLFTLLSLISGFEVLYAAIETSLLVNLLLATLTLGTALAGAYLLQRAAQTEETA